ncbi:MAG: 50S ribosomal protein L11 methyltransferase [Candidatus Heimdallarchaeota archaeon]|nr:50S ribosomal protein L11 methyltransferase [Candidatus Heimdallarchaeota archaeon]
MRIKRKDLEIFLEQLEKVSEPKIKFEQYASPPRVAANLLWIAGFDHDDIFNKNILDLGCGSGILAIGAAFFGARSATGIDIDCDSLKVAKKNAKMFELEEKCTWLCMAAEDCQLKGIDTVIMNPPFGMRKESISRDRIFLKAALSISSNVYSINPYAEKTHSFFTKYCKELDAEIVAIIPMNFEIKRQYNFHKKEKHIILVDLYHIRKK